MQLYLETSALAQRRRTDATILSRVNWNHLRRLLADLRFKSGLTPEELALRIHVNKSTVYRTEAHENKPELENIERWLHETKGPSLHDFFLLVESGGLLADLPTTTPSVDTLPATRVPLSHLKAGNDDSPISNAAALPTTDFKAFLELIGAAVRTMQNRLDKADQQAPSASDDETRGGSAAS